MNFIRARGSEVTNLKMTAMIDVVFLLLVFFLVGTRFRRPEGELDAYLPEKGAPVELHQREVPVDEIRITLRVSQAGKNDPTARPAVLLDGKSFPWSSAPPPARTFQNRLKELAGDAAIRNKVPVIIEAEPHLAYRWVIETLNLCRKMRFEQVNFAASKRNAPLPKNTSPPG
ncbi:MAG: biopolymer transporter ExbD [Planctomycetota bacterium]